MKPKNFILLFFFGLFLFLLPSVVEAACPLSCEDTGTNCLWGPPFLWTPPNPLQRPGVERVGTIQDIGKTDYLDGTSYCSRSNGKCQESAFPTGNNGQVCVAHDEAWDWGACNDCSKAGNWDYSESQCIQCNGKVESKYLGNTSTIYDNPCVDPPAGDSLCESACGADSQCDEAASGSNVSVSGGICNSCVFTANKPTISFTPSSFTFTAIQGGSNPASQTLEIWNSGVSGTTLNWSVSDNATWLTLSPTSGNSTGEHDSVTLSVSISGMTAGSYSATITISDPNASNSPRTVPVTLTITAPDLQITYIVFDSNKRVNYSIYNYGTAAAVASRSYLYVDGSYYTYDSASSLNANTGIDEYFSGWTACETGQSYSIEVCADRAGPNGAVAGTGQTVIESIETNNCKTQSLTCPACGGAVSLALSPNPANPSVTITATVSGLSICEDTTARIREGSCSGTQKCTCSISGSGCSCTFTGPASTTTYYACVDKNADGDYSDAGESDSEILTVQSVCTGTQTVSISGSGTCTVTASLTATGCDGQSWQIKDDGTTKCSGTVSGSPYPYTCSSWTVGAGAYTYNLYIGGVSKDSDSVTCPTTPNNPPTCNYLSASSTSGNAPLNVSFTASGSDTDGTIVQYEFDFGDGSSKVYSSTAGATHTYSAVGTYCATLRVQDDDGDWSTNTGSCPGGTCTAQIIVTEAGAGINQPSVTTNQATNVTQTSATLSGTLNSLGYDPATCPSCSCIVWFKWKLSTDSTWNETAPVSMTATGSIPPVTISGLTAGQTYYFEAYAKNGGSW